MARPEYVLVYTAIYELEEAIKEVWCFEATLFENLKRAKSILLQFSALFNSSALCLQARIASKPGNYLIALSNMSITTLLRIL